MKENSRAIHESAFQRTVLKLVLFAGALCLGGAAIPAGAESLMAGGQQYCLTGGLGLDGYDPVAFFPDGGGRPVKGSPTFSFEFDGVPYRFATQDDLDLFKERPARYLPQYGGWCSYSIALRMGMKGKPEFFEIRGGKLYLFGGSSMQGMWLMDWQSFVQKADANWSVLAEN